MTAGRSAAVRAVMLRQAARAGVWRRIGAWLGISRQARVADVQAAVWAFGAAGEEATARLLASLTREGWTVRHDLAVPYGRANLDHLLVTPCGTGVIVLDTKRWHRGQSTRLVLGRLHCGQDDRHTQVESVAGYARRVAEALDLPAVTVLPLLVVHGSPVAGGRLEARVDGGRLHVLGTDWLLPTLCASAKTRNPAQARRVASRVDRVMRPYA